jgi:hypothetical protein
VLARDLAPTEFLLMVSIEGDLARHGDVGGVADGEIEEVR